MGPTDRKEPAGGGQSSRPESDRTATAIITAQMAVGVVLAVSAGVFMGHALRTGYTPSWWIGGICLFIGVVLVVGGLVSARARARSIHLPSAPGARPKQADDSTAPRLGALLVYKYRLITEEQLERALEEQRRQKGGRVPLGEMLVSMKLITKSQLREALEYQRTQSRRPRGGARPS